MQPDNSPHPHAAPAAPARATRRAMALLLHAGAPERRHLLLGTAWLLVAAALEAVGPLLGKYYIDQYLLPGVWTCTTWAGCLRVSSWQAVWPA